MLQDNSPDYRQFDYIITNYMRERRVPGASIAVSRGGEFIIRKGGCIHEVDEEGCPWPASPMGVEVGVGYMIGNGGCIKELSWRGEMMGGGLGNAVESGREGGVNGDGEWG